METYRILLVDDEPSILESLSAFLEDAGHCVGPCASAEDALERIDAEPWDMAIVDLRLPGMTGERFMRRANERHGLSRFVIHTGSVDSCAAAISMPGIPESPVLRKPQLDMQVFLTTIEQVMGERAYAAYSDHR